MLGKDEIVSLLRKTGFPLEGYWVVAGAAMVLHGVKALTRDIDLGCTKELADRLQKEGYPVVPAGDGTRKIYYSDQIEIFEAWKDGKIITIEALPVVSLEGIMRMKEKLGREKDLDDIKRIRAHIAQTKSKPIAPAGG